MRDVGFVDMRSTLNLDDDVLEAARQIAEQRGKVIGEVASRLARRGSAPSPAQDGGVRNGIRLFAVRTDGGVVTPEMVRTLLDA